MGSFIPDSELIINPDGSIYHLNLKPEHLASSIIAVGDPERVASVSAYFDEIEIKISRREFVTHTGSYKGKRISVISTGMGTDNIEIFMNELDALVNVDFDSRQPRKELTSLNIVRVGTSGSMQAHVPAGALLASVYGVGLDTLMHFYKGNYSELEISVGIAVQKALSLPFQPYCVRGSEKLLAQVGKGLIQGNTVTCPGFFGPQGRAVRLQPAIPDIIERLSRVQLKDFTLSNFEMETAGYYTMGRLLGHEVLSLNAIVANRITGEFTSDPAEVVDRLIVHTLERI